MSYLTDIDKLARDDRQMRALSGASVDEIKILSKVFDEVEQEQKQKEYKEAFEKGIRKRKPGGGIKSKLNTAEKKVFFCLNYLKTYPTYDVLGHNFDMCRGAAHANTHKLIPVLALTFERLGCKPIRIINEPEDFIDAFGDIEKLIIDGVERRHFRSRNPETQKSDFSGKKNRIPRKT